MKIYSPSITLITHLVHLLKELYPSDYIRVYRHEALELVLEDLRWAGREYRRKPNIVAAKAASLLYDIIVLHPLTDGNKRLAVLATAAFLIKNGYYVPRSTMFRLALLIARNEVDKGEVYKWLLRELRPLRPRK